MILFVLFGYFILFRVHLEGLQNFFFLRAILGLFLSVILVCAGFQFCYNNLVFCTEHAVPSRSPNLPSAFSWYKLDMHYTSFMTIIFYFIVVLWISIDYFVPYVHDWVLSWVGLHVSELCVYRLCLISYWCWDFSVFSWNINLLFVIHNKVRYNRNWCGLQRRRNNISNVNHSINFIIF